MGKYTVLFLLVFVVILVACGEESEPTPCDEVEGTCLYLHFDGENCDYTGPSEMDAGPVTFIYTNEDENGAYVNLMRHTRDRTLQDMVDYMGEEPSTKTQPGWAYSLPGIFRNVPAGSNATWEGELEPGIHSMICANVTPLGVYFGGGFEVKE